MRIFFFKNFTKYNIRMWYFQIHFYKILLLYLKTNITLVFLLSDDLQGLITSKS